jgi:hypothetical protein
VEQIQQILKLCGTTSKLSRTSLLSATVKLSILGSRERCHPIDLERRGEEMRDRERHQEEEEEGKDASYAGGLTPWEAASG